MKTHTLTQVGVDQWNEWYKPGHPCLLRLDDGNELETRTRSAAWLLFVNVKTGRGVPVVSVEGKAGGWHLNRVRMIETHKI